MINVNKEKMFIVADEDGNQTALEMIKVDNVDGKSIIWYTDNKKDENGHLNVYVSSFTKEDHSFVLNPLTDEEEAKYLKMLDK